MKLHQLLAVETSRSTQTQRVRADLLNTFDKKRHLFEQKIVTFTPSGEGQAPVTEQQSDLQSTVPREIAWLRPHLAEALDLELWIDEANTKARANVELPDGTVLIEQVPATALLQLQKRVEELKQFAAAIPTLDPAKGFNPDKDQGAGVFRARDVRKNRTAKVQEPLTLAPATDKHPAQVTMITSDKVTGSIVEQEWSGLMTPAEKSSILDRIEILSRAVRSARSAANEQEVDRDKKIGDKLLAFVFG